MRRRISRKSKLAIREALNNIKKAEDTENEAQEVTAFKLDADFRSSMREQRKERSRQMRQAGRDFDAMIETNNDEETIIEKEYFFSEGDMVEMKRARTIKMSGEDEDDRRIGLVLSTKDYVHEYYSSGKPKRISKGILVDVLVGTVIEEWPAKKIKICE